MRVLQDGLRYELDDKTVIEFLQPLDTIELIDVLVDHLIYLSRSEFSSDLAKALHYLNHAGTCYSLHVAVIPPAAADNSRGMGEGVPSTLVDGTPSAPPVEDEP